MQLEVGQLVRFRADGLANMFGVGIYKGPSPENEYRCLVYWTGSEHTSDPMAEWIEAVEA